jgi:glycosyltransferase involved in cell wall biosynthesis
LKILHINRDECTGGASRSAHRLNQGLRRLNEESEMYVWNKSSDDPSIKRFVPAQDRFSFRVRNLRHWYLRRAIHRYDETSSKDRTYFSDDRTVFYKDVIRQIPRSDVINLHWVAEFLDYGSFFDWLPKTMPLVWTLHDMAPFTGGCCYDMDCGKFAQQCGACPQLGSNDKFDLTRDIWRRKRRYYKSLNHGRFHIVTPSRWLGEEAKRSSLFSQFSKSVIPYGLDLEVFRPRDRNFARDVLRIPSEAKALLFVSQDVTTARKGFPSLVDALAGMPCKNVFLIALGIGPVPEINVHPHVHLPSVNDDGFLSLIYSAADVFVAPSLADNLPNTILESIACGTPVVAFNAGGIPDAVRPGVTGLLAKTGDAAELRGAILQLLGNDSKRAEMSANCRRIALAEYSLELQASRYVQLYQSMLTTATAARAS